MKWALNRSLYSGKLKLMAAVPWTEGMFEKKAKYPSRIDLFRLDAPTIRAFIRGLPKDRQEELIRLADNACEGKMLGFSSIELDYGNPIDWQANPLTGGRCDVAKKWHRIPDFDRERGDVKAIWEASRLTHFITLARAHLLTGDRKYYRAFSEQLSDWIEKNPYPYGANYKCGQECSLRMVNGLLAHAIFQSAGVSADIDRKNIETLVLRCYRKVKSNFFYAYKCVRNNHAISELMGMIVGAWCCAEEGQFKLARRILNEEIGEQFTDDGGYRQFSFNYQRLVLQEMEAVLCAEERAGRILSESSRKKLLKAASLMHQCQDGSGDMPNYGANDGALAFPVTSCGYRDFRPVINAVAAMISGKRLYEPGDHDEELLWFGNGKERPIQQRGRKSRAYRGAGLFTVRKADSWGMVVLNDYKSRPSHMDQLHFDLWVDGVNVLCDGGTYSYALEEGGKLVKDESHNTVAADGVTQMNKRGAFLIYDWTKRGRVKHTDGMFYGECESRNGYRLHRTVEATEYGYRITDEAFGEEGAGFRALFHTPCEVREKNGCVELTNGGRAICRLSSQKPADITDGYRSLRYLEKEGVHCISYKGNVRGGKARIVTEIMTKVGGGGNG